MRNACRGEWATSLTANIGGDRMNPGIRNLPPPSAKELLGRRMGEVRETSCSYDGKLSLKANESRWPKTWRCGKELLFFLKGFEILH